MTERAGFLRAGSLLGGHHDWSPGVRISEGWGGQFHPETPMEMVWLRLWRPTYRHSKELLDTWSMQWRFMSPTMKWILRSVPCDVSLPLADPWTMTWFALRGPPVFPKHPDRWWLPDPLQWSIATVLPHLRGKPEFFNWKKHFSDRTQSMTVVAFMLIHGAKSPELRAMAVKTGQAVETFGRWCWRNHNLGTRRMAVMAVLICWIDLEGVCGVDPSSSCFPNGP